MTRALSPRICGRRPAATRRARLDTGRPRDYPRLTPTIRRLRRPWRPGMSGASIRMEKLTPHIGAEIHGVDLARPLDEQTFKEVHGALVEHGVIFFRDQHISPEQQKAFGRLFGELHMHPAAPSLLEGHPEILVIHADEKSKRVAGEDWHSDVSCDLEPPMGSILYMHELPPVGGDTLFASMYAAYDGLSDALRRLLEECTALHESEHVYRGRYGVKDEGKQFPEAEHPVIRTH